MAQIESMINLFNAVAENDSTSISSARNSFVEATSSGGTISPNQLLTPGLTEAYSKYVDMIKSGSTEGVLSTQETLSSVSSLMAGFPTWAWIVIGGLAISLFMGRKKRR